MKKLVSLFVFLVSVTAFAQSSQDDDQFLEILRLDVQMQKMALVEAAMELTAEEAEAFWPIYEEYQSELVKINDVKLEVIRQYAKFYTTMTDEIAKELIRKRFEVEEMDLDLTRKYHRKIEKALSPVRAARFLQVDTQIKRMIDMQLAAELPLFEKFQGQE